MNTGTVSVRYAKALLQYAVEQGDAAQVYLEMQTLASRMRSVRAIHDRLVDVGAGRGDCLLFMAVSYQDLYRLKNGIVPVELITATPVGDERRARLKQLVENVEQGRVEWTHTVDPSLDGGFVLLVDGFRLDASVAGKLQRIRKELIEKNNRII